MSLNYKETQALKRRFKKLAEDGKHSPQCPSCGSTSLKFGALLENELGPFLAPISRALIRRTCQDCGFVMLFDRKIAGV